jgi:DNA polymerase III alpha subunit
MTPIFKSTYSIGKSILTLDDSEESEGPDSIITICNDHDIKTLVLVEDRMTGFIKAHNVCKENEIQLIFGLRITCCNDVSDESITSNHKIIIFSKNDEGCKLLNKISSHAAMNCNGRIDFKYLNSVWQENNVDLAIPFYDSFIFNNQMYLANCVPDFSKIKPTFFLEENGLPFDRIIAKHIDNFTSSKNNQETKLVKSIFYKDKKDYAALQTYKILCNRSFGKAASLSSPNLNHFGSDEFSFESYLEKNAN